MGVEAPHNRALAIAADILDKTKRRIAAVHEGDCEIAQRGSRRAVCTCHPYMVDAQEGAPG